MGFELGLYKKETFDSKKLQHNISFLKDLQIGLPGMLEMKVGFVADLEKLIKQEQSQSNPDLQKIAGWQQEIIEAKKDIENLNTQMAEVPQKTQRLQQLANLAESEKRVLTIIGSSQGTTRDDLSALLKSLKARRSQNISLSEKFVLDDIIQKVDGAKNVFDNKGSFDSLQIVLAKNELAYLKTIPQFGEKVAAAAILAEIEEEMVAELARLQQKNSTTAEVFQYPIAQIRELQKDVQKEDKDLRFLHTNDPSRVMLRAEVILDTLHQNVIAKEEVSHPFKKFLVDTKNKINDFIRNHFSDVFKPKDSEFQTSAISSSFNMYKKAASHKSGDMPSVQNLAIGDEAKVPERKKQTL